MGQGKFTNMLEAVVFVSLTGGIADKYVSKPARCSEVGVLCVLQLEEDW